MSTKPRTALVIGSGFGGLALAIRLQALGFQTTIIEALEGPGGRAAVRKQDGFTFDMGPTVITVPHFFEELFSLSVGDAGLASEDFPEGVRAPRALQRSGESGGEATQRYCRLVPIDPFYRIFFDDGTHFDYDGDDASTRERIRVLEPADVDGFDRFQRDAAAIFRRGFLDLGYTHFGSVASMLRIAPELLRLDALRTLFGFASKYFSHPKLRQIFSFETLLIGGSPLRVPSIYAMIHLVEKTWGVHFAMGGTGALVQGLVRKFSELGGTIRYGTAVERIETAPSGGVPGKRRHARRATGVRLACGTALQADLVASNADFVHTHMHLLGPENRSVRTALRLKAARQSMSLVVIYFGFEARPDDGVRLRHHNIILGPRYEGLLREIFEEHTLSEDFSQYLHVPTLTDPSLAPPGMHAAYTLIPVPNALSGINWSAAGPPFVAKVLRFLEERGYIPELGERMRTMSFITPDHFAGTLRSDLGNAFGLEPTLAQSAYFRPHNRSEDLDGLYFVGANAQPGAGTPSVLMSAKMTARLIAEDHA